RFLPYITGGAAYGKTKISSSYAGDGFGSLSASSTNWGWTVGGGVEYAITNNWTFKTEYLYVDLGSTDYAYADGYGYYSYAGTVDTKFHTLKAGVNYKF
ncbi:outer membrane protein, partial [Xanthobacter versatilis]|uniref:outer membrane protein n=1 Tax=Xanthobacter autotrophicus (strain ATCC BAA-1158 / Py2) TaxID=78245 RepID=UPI00372B5107